MKNEWTKEQKKMLMAKPKNKTWKQWTRKINLKFNLNRSQATTYARFYALTHADEPTKKSAKKSVKKPTKKSVKKTEKKPATQREWAGTEELQLLVDFYQMSVDEVRSKYNLPFYLVAKKFEEIHDMTEPHHSDLLMGASRILNALKEQAMVKPKMSRREERKLRKLAKKEKALVARLKELRRDKNE